MSNKILVHTINIDLPDKLLNEYKTKKGELKQKEIDTLTKTGNIKRVKKQLVVNLHTVKDLEEPRVYIEDEKRKKFIKDYIEEKKEKKEKKQKININELPKANFEGLENYIDKFDKKKNIKKIENIYTNINNKKLQDELNSKLSKFKNTFDEGAKKIKQERGKTKLKELLKNKLENIRSKKKIKDNNKLYYEYIERLYQIRNKNKDSLYNIYGILDELFEEYIIKDEDKKNFIDYYMRNLNDPFFGLKRMFISNKNKEILKNTPNNKIQGAIDTKKTTSTEFDKKDIQELRNEFNEEIIKQYRIATSKDDLMNYKNYYNETQYKLVNDFINKHMDIIQARYDNFIGKFKNTDSHINIKKYISNHESSIVNELLDENSYNNYIEKYNSFMQELSNELSILKRARTQKSKDEVNEYIEKLIYKNNLPSKLLEIFTFELKNKDEFKYSNFRPDDYYCFNKFQFIHNKKNREKNDDIILESTKSRKKKY